MAHSPNRPTCPPSSRPSSRSWPEYGRERSFRAMPNDTITPTARDAMANPALAGFEVHGITRASFILRGALAAGAFYGASAVTPFVSQALAQTGGGDVEILNFALTLEYLEAEFYAVKGKSLALSGEAKAYARQFGAEEAAHVSALTTVI